MRRIQIGNRLQRMNRAAEDAAIGERLQCLRTLASAGVKGDARLQVEGGGYGINRGVRNGDQNSTCALREIGIANCLDAWADERGGAARVLDGAARDKSHRFTPPMQQPA